MYEKADSFKRADHSGNDLARVSARAHVKPLITA